jgi:hypothetical protein
MPTIALAALKIRELGQNKLPTKIYEMGMLVYPSYPDGILLNCQSLMVFSLK